MGVDGAGRRDESRLGRARMEWQPSRGHFERHVESASDLGLDHFEHAIGLASPSAAHRVASFEHPRIRQIRHPGLAFRRAGGRPWLEPGFSNRRRRLAHFLGAPAAVLNHPLEKVGALLLPVDAGKRLGQRRHDLILDAEARAAVKLSMTIASSPLTITLRHIFVAEATPSLSEATVASNPSATSKRLERRRRRSAEEQRHADAERRDRGHDRAFDIARATASIERRP